MGVQAYDLETEARAQRRHYETGHREIDERVDVLDHSAHVGNPIQVEHAEVVHVDEHECEQQEQLRPLAHVA